MIAVITLFRYDFRLKFIVRIVICADDVQRIDHLPERSEAAARNRESVPAAVHFVFELYRINNPVIREPFRLKRQRLLAQRRIDLIDLVLEMHKRDVLLALDLLQVGELNVDLDLVRRFDFLPVLVEYRDIEQARHLHVLRLDLRVRILHVVAVDQAIVF